MKKLKQKRSYCMSLRGRQWLAGRSNPANCFNIGNHQLDHHAEQSIVRLVMTTSPQPSAKLGGGLKTSLQGRADLRTDENEHVIAHAYVIADSFVIAHLLRDLIRLRNREDFSTSLPHPLRNDEPNQPSLISEGVKSSLQGRELERGFNVKSPLIPLYKGGKEARQLGSEAAKHSKNISFAKQTEKVYSPLTTHYSLCKKAAFTLAEVFSPRRTVERKIAFTLAEVLITLGIIGVVAALTLPNLVAKYRGIVIVNQLKKAYSTLSQAMLFTIQKDGDYSSLTVVDANQESINNWYKTYLKPYIKVTKECYNKKGCWADDVKTLGGLEPKYNSEAGIGHNIVVFNTADGYNVSIDAYSSGESWFGVNSKNLFSTGGVLVLFVDVNGNKKPNIVGKDIFMFIFSPSIGFVPAGKDASDDEINSNCSTSNTTNWGGYYCAAKIMSNGWKIKDDYPW